MSRRCLGTGIATVDQQQKTKDKCFRKTDEGLEPNFYLSHVREKHIPTLNEPEET